MNVLLRRRPPSRRKQASKQATHPATHPNVLTMSLDRIQPLHPTRPIRPTHPPPAVRLGSRFSVPRGLIAGTLAATALAWGQYAFLPGTSRLSVLAQIGLYVGLVLLHVCR